MAEQKGVEEQFGQLGPVLIERYGKDFVDAWNAVLDNLKLKSMSADKPQYLALSAASSPTSPIRQLFEAVAVETQLTARAARASRDGRRRSDRRCRRDVTERSHQARRPARGRGACDRVWPASASISR